MSIYKRGSTYWVNVVDPRNPGRQVRRSTRTHDKKTALLQEAQLKVELDRGTFFEIRAAPTQSISFTQLMSEFLAHQKVAGRRSLDTFFIPNVRVLQAYFKDMPVDDITSAVIERFKLRRGTARKPGTVNRNLAVLRRALGLAKRWGYLRENPAEGIELLREPKGRVAFLKASEQRVLLEACHTGDVRDFLHLLMRVGMRRGELSRLKVGDVDFSQGLVSIHLTKNGFPRHVPLSQDALAVLRRRCAGLSSEELVFKNSKGEETSRWWFKTAWKGIRERAVPAGFRVHDLRHVFATDLVSAGAGLPGIGGLLGHRSTKTTEIYAHVTQEHQRKTIQMLDAFHDTKHNTVVGIGD